MSNTIANMPASTIKFRTRLFIEFPPNRLPSKRRLRPCTTRPLSAGRNTGSETQTAHNGCGLRGHCNVSWTAAYEESEMPEGLLIHDLRDTAASLMIPAGASIKAVQRQMGHSSASMTLDTYGLLFESVLEDLVDRLDEKFAAADVAPARPEDEKVVHVPR